MRLARMVTKVNQCSVGEAACYFAGPYVTDQPQNKEDEGYPR
jgi:hypothetical protein